MGDGEADPRLATPCESDPVALVVRVALELEVVEEHEDIGLGDQSEEPLPGQEGRLHQRDPRALHVSPSALRPSDREV